MKRHLLILTLSSVSAAPAWSCIGPPPTEPPRIERLAGESDAAFTGRQDAFRNHYRTRESQQNHVQIANGLYGQVIEEGHRQDALWDAATNVILARVVSIRSTTSEDLGDRVRYRTDRVLKGRSRISTVHRVGVPDFPPPPCYIEYDVSPDAPVGEAVVIFLPTSRSTTVSPTQTLPLSSVASERLWAIINGTAPTP